MSKSDTERLGEYVKRRRAELGLTLRDVAAKSKLHPSTIGRLEAGDFESVALPTLQRLAYALDVDYEDLATVAGYLLPAGFPSLPVYLRTKHGKLTDEQIAHLKNEVRFMEWEREQTERRNNRSKPKRRGHDNTTD